MYILERRRLGRGLRRVVEDDEGLVLAQRTDLYTNKMPGLSLRSDFNTKGDVSRTGRTYLERPQ